MKCLWKLTFPEENCIMHRDEYLLKFRFAWRSPSAFCARSIDKERSKSELLEDRLFGKNNAIYVAGNSQNARWHLQDCVRERTYCQSLSLTRKATKISIEIQL